MSLVVEGILETVCNDSTTLPSYRDSNRDMSVDFHIAKHPETKKDKLGRDHLIYKRTGPLVICISNGIFHYLTMEVPFFSLKMKFF